MEIYLKPDAGSRYEKKMPGTYNQFYFDPDNSA